MAKTMLGFLTPFFTTACLDTAWASGAGHEHGDGGGSGLGGIIVFLGVTTLACLITTFLLGRRMPKNRKALFLWHKRMGLMTVVLGITHGTLVLLFH